MSQSQKRLLAFSVIFLAVLLLAFSLYSLLWYGTLRITNAAQFDRIDINGVSYSGAQIQAQPEFRLRPGAVTVAAFATTAEDVSYQADVPAFSETEVALDYNELPAETISTELTADLPDGYAPLSQTLLENNNWLVMFVGSVDGTAEGFVNVYQFDTSMWQLVEAGTGLDREYMEEQGFPESVISFIERSGD